MCQTTPLTDLEIWGYEVTEDDKDFFDDAHEKKSHEQSPRPAGPGEEAD